MNDIYHYGIKGQKWGVRRFQNEDGSLTSAGEARYMKDVQEFNRLEKSLNKSIVKLAKRQKSFNKRAKKPILTDIDLTLKKKQGVKLAKAYRKYTKAGERFCKNYQNMVANYGEHNINSPYLEKGRAYMEQLERARNSSYGLAEQDVKNRGRI